MTIKVESGQSGWGNYVVYGTKEAPRDSEKVQFLEGDIALGDRLCESNNYQESYYRIVLGFEGKPSDEVMKSAYEDFKEEFFKGFKRDEYHIDAVIHKDTDNYHIHIRVAKQNLKTNTHLQLYMDKIDRPRKELIQDYISLKYGFNIARETNKKVFKDENTKIDIINKWREQHNQKPFDFSNKKGQKEAEKEINSYISELIKSELINSQNDIKDTLQELGLKVEKFGHDIKKDFYYATVSNESGKIRIKGDIYKDEFFKHNAKDRTASIENNRRIEQEREPNQERIKTVRRELNKANEKRYNKVTELFKSARARAEAEHSKTIENGRVESLSTNKLIKHSNISSSNDIHTKSNEFKKTPKRYKREDDRGQKRATLSEISGKRAYLRQTKTSLLLQNKLKERANERYYEQIIRRVAESRETQQSVIREAERERKIEYTNFERVQSKIRGFGEKISGAFETIRRKALSTINEVKEKLNFGKLKKDDNLEKLVKTMEAGTQDKSVSSSFNKTKEVQKTLKNNDLKSYFAEKLSAKFDEVDKQQELQAPAKKRSHSRDR